MERGLWGVGGLVEQYPSAQGNWDVMSQKAHFLDYLSSEWLNDISKKILIF